MNPIPFLFTELFLHPAVAFCSSFVNGRIARLQQLPYLFASFFGILVLRAFFYYSSCFCFFVLPLVLLEWNTGKIGARINRNAIE